MAEEINIELKETHDAHYNTIYQATIRHDKLNKYQVIKGKDRYVVKEKAMTKMAQWNAQWDKEVQKEKKEKERLHKKKDIENNISVAATKTKEAMQEIESLAQIISASLRENENISWEHFFGFERYFNIPEPEYPSLKPLPMEMEDKFQLDHKAWKKQKMEERYVAALLIWEEDIEENEINYQEALEKLDQERKEALEKWEQEQQNYIEEKKLAQTTIEEKKQGYLNGNKELVIDFCNHVLSDFKYPDYFPQSYELDYSPTNKMLVIDYQLPLPHNIPTLKEVKYVQSSGQFKETHISQSQINSLYDSVVYQIALCTIYKLFNANHPDVVVQIVFNGFVESINPSTGKNMVACILSVQTNHDEFVEINLINVDPKACFKTLKGVGSSQLYSITPIAPILNMNREDKRFIASYDVAYELDESINIAAMDWEDFEHLIRELFEKEFMQYGGEVKITQASRDRGVDAVAFDPDPIRGGKIVIQAKRYTNTVGVASVRDLYGTVINEGATKGILISTADYGPDAYDFAKGKPLTLLNGGNLLHLLEKHGHKAKIDLQEAKKIIAENEKQKEKIY